MVIFKSCVFVACTDAMSLEHYGITQDSRIFLSVKDIEVGSVTSHLTSSTSSSLKPAATNSSTPDFQTELKALLLRHFLPADVEKVADEFNRVLYSIHSIRHVL